jgi:hypothetical protein
MTATDSDSDRMMKSLSVHVDVGGLLDYVSHVDARRRMSECHEDANTILQSAALLVSGTSLGDVPVMSNGTRVG